jgi:DNA-binding transcriptional ArsR family regulator
VSDAPPPDEVLDVLGDEYAREILIATRTRPMTATTLADELDAAPSTVYARIDDLTAAGFLAERTRRDDDGNHTAEYAARLDRLTVRVSENGFELETDLTDRDEAADRLHTLWSDLQ